MRFVRDYEESFRTGKSVSALLVNYHALYGYQMYLSTNLFRSKFRAYKKVTVQLLTHIRASLINFAEIFPHTNIAHVDHSMSLFEQSRSYKGFSLSDKFARSCRGPRCGCWSVYIFRVWLPASKRSDTKGTYAMCSALAVKTYIHTYAYTHRSRTQTRISARYNVYIVHVGIRICSIESVIELGPRGGMLAAEAARSTDLTGKTFTVKQLTL